MKTRVMISALLLVVFLHFASALSAQDNSYDFSLDVGSMFTTAGNYGSFFSHRIAPSFNWDISKDFQLQVGTVFSSTRMTGSMPLAFSPSGDQQLLFAPSSPISSTSVYAFGVYHLSPKLSISGGTWFEQMHFDVQEGFMSPYSQQQNPQGMMLGLEYRVSENLRFGFEMSASRGMSPYMPGGFHNTAFPGSFYNRNPFHRSPW